MSNFNLNDLFNLNPGATQNPTTSNPTQPSLNQPSPAPPGTTPTLAQLLAAFASTQPPPAASQAPQNPMQSLITALATLTDNTAKLAQAKSQTPSDLFKQEVTHTLELQHVQTAITALSKQLTNLEEKIAKTLDYCRLIANKIAADMSDLQKQAEGTQKGKEGEKKT